MSNKVRDFSNNGQQINWNDIVEYGYTIVSIVPPPLYDVGIAIAVEGTQIISGQYYAR